MKTQKLVFTILFSVVTAALVGMTVGSFLTAYAADAVVSLGKPVFSDGEQGGNETVNINDGSVDTRWCASDSQFPHYVEMDLEGWYDVSAVDVNFHTGPNRYYFFKLYAKAEEDGEFVLMNDGDHTDNTTMNLVKTSANAKKVRYLKVEVTGAQSDNVPWASIREWTVYGTPTTESVADVVEIESFYDRYVSFGTTAEELNLPETASIRLDNDFGYMTVNLDWDISVYKPDVAGEYVLTSSINSLAPGLTNSHGFVFTYRVIVRPENYVSPVVARERIDFNDGWKFLTSTNSAASGTLFDDSTFETVSTPHTWFPTETERASESVTEKDAWYRKFVTIPVEKEGGRVYLEFEASYSATTVYVNGNAVGEPHYGGYTLFRVDITDYLIFGAQNLIAVKVNGNQNNVPPIAGDFTRFGGITGNVSLIYANDVHATLDDHGSPGVHVTPERVGETTSWNVKIESDITNSGDAQTVTVKYTIRDIESFEPVPGIPEEITPFDEDTMYGDTVYFTASESLDLAANSDTAFEVTVPFENPRLWNGRYDPYRYALDFEIYNADGTLVDCVTQNFGFRYFHVDENDGFYLNGNKYPLRGVGYHEDTDGKGSAMTHEDWEESFAIIYEIGATGVRLVHYPHDPYSYELCDKYGLVSWTELAQISGIMTIDNDADINPIYEERTKNELLELIRQQKNHPSVCFWGIQNEVGVGRSKPYGDGVDEFMNELVSMAKEEDPTRLTTQASCNWAINASEWYTDLLAINTYPLWYANGNLGDTVDNYIAGSMDTHEWYADKSLGVSEYGAGSSENHHSEHPTQPVTTGRFHPEEWSSITHETAYAEIVERDNLWFTSVWCMFDFASSGRREGEFDGINDKGLVNRDRSVKKDPFYFYKANWTSAELDPFVYITSRRMTHRQVPSNDVKVYSNLDSVELFCDGESLGMMTNEGLGIFTMENVSFGSIGESHVFEAKSGEISDIVTWTRVGSDNIEFSAISEDIYVHEEDSTILLSGVFDADDLSDMFISHYGATFSVVKSDLVTPVTSGTIEPGMRIVITSENGKVSKMYAVISTSIATGKPVSASTQSSTNTAEKAVDGIISTEAGYKWDALSSEKGGGTLIIDLEKEYTLTKTKTYFFPGWSNTRKYYFNIYVGTTEDNFELVVDRSKNTDVGEVNDLLGGIKGRFIKVEILGNSDYEGGNTSALGSILEIEVNGYNLIEGEAKIDNESLVVTLPASWGSEVYPSKLLEDITVDGNAILSTTSEAYYIQGGDKLVVADYAGGKVEYDIVFDKSTQQYIGISSADEIDSTKKDSHIFVVPHFNKELVKALEDGGYKYAYLGDVNADGKVNTDDIAEYARAVIGIKVLATDVISDYNGDGKVSLADMSACFKALFK